MTTMPIHEWMVNYTRQTEWIDRRGLFLWLAFFAGTLGGGLYLASLFFDSLAGMAAGWLIVAVVKGGAHFMDLGKPWRAWRIIFRPGSSWMSRGILFVIAFMAAGAVQMALFRWLPGSPAEVSFKALAGAAAIGVAIYSGFVLKTVRGVPFWNSALLPPLVGVYGVLCGLGVMIVIGLAGGGINLAAAGTASRWLLFASAVLLGVYLWTAARRDETGRKSVLQHIHGELALVFWAGIVGLGIIAPVAVAFSSYFISGVSTAIIIAGVAGELAGGLSLGYCVLKAGAYKPLVARPHHRAGHITLTRDGF